MLKFAELLLKSAENIAKTLVSSTEQVSIKAALSSVEESEKIGTAIDKRITKHKAVRKELDKLFD